MVERRQGSRGGLQGDMMGVLLDIPMRQGFDEMECDKVPSSDLFYMWCLTQTNVCLYLPFDLALYLSSMALGSTPVSRICRGYWVTRLSLSYDFDTSGIVRMPIREMGATTRGKIWVLVRGVGKQWRILDNDIMEPTQQAEPEDIPEPAFLRRGASLVNGYDRCGYAASGDGLSTFSLGRVMLFHPFLSHRVPTMMVWALQALISEIRSADDDYDEDT
ncbi:unnamed protein product [Lactuca saligna]|uniref:Uncharacterized protein n=1 Tax=Lactuca saligna TaxID=75948 RepID=A0AA35Z8M7_LACSI|nr:unnamed protein product [Lactuca saligna]